MPCHALNVPLKLPALSNVQMGELEEEEEEEG